MIPIEMICTSLGPQLVTHGVLISLFFPFILISLSLLCQLLLIFPMITVNKLLLVYYQWTNMSLQTSLLPLLHHHQLQTHQIPCLILTVSAKQVNILTAFSKDCLCLCTLLNVLPAVMNCVYVRRQYLFLPL